MMKMCCIAHGCYFETDDEDEYIHHLCYYDLILQDQL